MNKPTVISVNPSQIAEGSRYPELFAKNMRLSRYHTNDAHHTLLSLCLPTRRSGFAFSFWMLITRLMASAALVWSAGIEKIISLSPIGICALLCSALLFLGFLTRPVAIVVSVYYILALAGNHEAVAYASEAACILIITTLAITGPGRISIDQIIRRSIIAHRKRRISAPTITYRAYKDTFR